MSLSLSLSISVSRFQVDDDSGSFAFHFAFRSFATSFAQPEEQTKKSKHRGKKLIFFLPLSPPFFCCLHKQRMITVCAQLQGGVLFCASDSLSFALCTQPKVVQRYVLWYSSRIKIYHFASSGGKAELWVHKSPHNTVPKVMSSRWYLWVRSLKTPQKFTCHVKNLCLIGWFGHF